ncbi:MAG: matrixin family metalloprotease [Mobilicoccus sp.]|nr:matrixin family metalloprotease [Mobilicoccus sp.]
MLFRRGILVAAVMGIGLAVPGVAHAAPDDVLQAAPSARVVKTGDRVLVRGTLATSQERTVRLQRLVGRTWRTVAESSTTGTFALRLPTDTNGVEHYRVLAPAAGRAAEQVTPSFTVGVGAGDTRSHAFLTRTPVRWDPCTPVGYRVNLDGAPPEALADVRRAVSLASAASGVPFTYRGTTSMVPGSARTTGLENYPADTQLVIAYTAPERTSYLRGRGDVLGVGGVFYDLSPERINNRAWHRTLQGYVVLNSTKSLPSGFGSGRSTGELGTWGQVLMHEIGHTMGLDHVNAPMQIMHPETTEKEAVWGLGDLTGLHRLGASAGCFSGSTNDVGRGPSRPIVVGHSR